MGIEMPLTYKFVSTLLEPTVVLEPEIMAALAFAVTPVVPVVLLIAAARAIALAVLLLVVAVSLLKVSSRLDSPGMLVVV